ncbi:hypothetical protein HK107_00385 [Parvularcula sp. ZS-1/3]|uniref:Uncharacterized protein n=1 Tax=Parvularcula mediterranea TaxID=2732508 RepID=A0A7Y3RIP4_9PROT|nr:hypothetical protein [Parvularcula mediterranea]NNU14778.1 hypothetical protein [Parvularcula mediterranea]
MSELRDEYLDAITFAEEIAEYRDFRDLLKRTENYEADNVGIKLSSKAGIIIRLSRIFAYSKNKDFSRIFGLLPSTVSAMREALFSPADTAVMIMFLRRVSSKDQRLATALGDLGLRKGTVDIAPLMVSREVRQVFSRFDPGIAQLFSIK